MSADPTTAPTTSGSPSTGSTTTFRPVARWVLSQQARGTLIWLASLSALAAMYIAFYPAIQDSGLEGFVDNLPPELAAGLGYDRITSPAGYLDSAVFGLLIPILLMAFAVMRGGALIAGQEQDGTLELELTAPIPRTQVYVGRMLSLWTAIATIAVGVTAASAVMVALLDMDLAIGNVVATGAGLVLLGIAIGTVALAAGAATGRREIATAVGAAVAVLSFMLDAIGNAVTAEWMTAISPFSWYIGGDPLTNGPDLGGWSLLVLLTAVAAGVARQRFARRDLMV